MIRRWSTALICTLTVLSGGVIAAAPAAAAGCADIEVFWARGTAEPGAPIGYTGLAFVEALRAKRPDAPCVLAAFAMPRATTSAIGQ